LFPATLSIFQLYILFSFSIFSLPFFIWIGIINRDLLNPSLFLYHFTASTPCRFFLFFFFILFFFFFFFFFFHLLIFFFFFFFFFFFLEITVPKVFAQSPNLSVQRAFWNQHSAGNLCIFAIQSATTAILTALLQQPGSTLNCLKPCSPLSKEKDKDQTCSSCPITKRKAVTSSSWMSRFEFCSMLRFCVILRYIRRGKPDAGFALFESESLKWPGFVEFDDVNGKVLTYSAQDR